MTHVFRNILRRFIGTALAVPMMACVVSCDSVIYEGMPECGVRLTFVYDYNMEFANAFHSKVDCLTVIIYDEQGNFVSQTGVTEGLDNTKFALIPDLEAGYYIVAAYGGLECEAASFAPLSDWQTTPLAENGIRLATVDENGVSRESLHPLFFGLQEIVVPDHGREILTDYTIRMMKDTNNFRIIMQHLNGKPVNVNDFTFEIVDDNGLFDFCNRVVADQEISYQPWSRGQVSVGLNGDNTENVVAYAEFSTSRLIVRDEKETASRSFIGTEPGTSSVASPRLHIALADTGTTVIDIPLLNYLMLYKSDLYRTMDSQEFLDRTSEWNMTFFLDERDVWQKTTIIVNDWVVRINNIDESNL